jgi:chromate transporter
VLLLALTSFGGPQAHIAHFLRVLVTKRAYLSEADLIELNALCNILPGPTSTQTITAIGYRIGGAKLAYLTLLVWMLPAVIIMTTAGIVMSNLQEKDISISFTKFIQPMAVGFVSYAAYMISKKTVNSKTGIGLMIFAGLSAYFIRTPYVFPAILILAGLTTSFKYRAHPKEEKNGLKIQWNNFILWGGVLIGAALLGHFTKALPIRLFENFYRNGSLIFGGGQVLIPLLYTEFVQFKDYLSSQEFLSGYAMAQSVPGPVFSFTAYIGALSMREYGVFGELIGALAATFGIFLPGTFLIFFVIRFWEDLKKYRPVRASLEGINAASAGLVAAAAILLFQPLDSNFLNVSFIIGTFCLLTFTRIPHPFIILVGLLAGFLL